MSLDENVWNDLFHCCALRAYVEVACQSREWPPDSETTRRLAEHYYETELKTRNAKPGSG